MDTGVTQSVNFYYQLFFLSIVVPLFWCSVCDVVLLSSRFLILDYWRVHLPNFKLVMYKFMEVLSFTLVPFRE